MRMRLLGLWCAMAMYGSVSQAADIYRWTDDRGKAHASDRPPHGIPRERVTHDHLRVHGLTEREREEAQAPALAHKARPDRGVRALPPSYAQEPLPLTAPQVPELQPDETECQRLVRLYRESEACFAPYKIANGRTRPEAFEYCTPMVDPSIKCGYMPP